MVLVGQAIRQGLRIAGKLDKKYNINKIFVDKYVPPGYRKTVNRIFDIVGTAGGAYGIYNAFIAPDTPGNDGTVQYKKRYVSKTYSQNKTRRRQATCYSPRSKQRQYANRWR